MLDQSISCAPTKEDLQKASELLKTLIQIDTTNPPGNEGVLIDRLQFEFQAEGITPEIVGASKDRPNLVARLEALPENRKAPPLVLSCHVDVVPVEDPTRWEHPPFSGAEADGCIWGRGAIDMKGFAVMAFMAIYLLKKHHVPINRDVIFLAVSDEENGTEYGSKWIVEERPDLLHNPEYIINEVGGFTVHRGENRFYPVQVAEKGVAWLRMTARGEPGHSSMVARKTSVTALANAIAKLGNATLPWHPTEPAIEFLNGFSKHETGVKKQASKLMFNKIAGKTIVKGIPDKAIRASVEAILRNTATPTRIQAGSAVNVIPTTASVDIDGRLIPGQTSDDLIREIRQVIGDRKGKKFEIEVLKESGGAVFPVDTDLYRAIEDTMIEADPDGIVVPSMIPGFTDSQNYAKLGAVCYGFYPLKLDPDMNFASMFHGDNERIPVEGFHWGIQTLMRLLDRFLVG